jgi:serine/threonine protein kinase
VEAFLALAESGEPPEPEAFASRYPDLGEDLVQALEGLSLVRGLVGKPGEIGRRLEAGKRLAGYRIIRELGSGGMGIVYEAHHVDLDRPVALKVLDARATRDSNGVRRFQEEAKMAAGLHHTHIVPVFDVGHVGGLCYYAMQRIEGTGLDRVLRIMRRDRSTGAGSSSNKRISSHPSLPVNLEESASGSISWPAERGAPPGSPLAPRERERDQHDESVFVPPRGSAYFRWVAEAGRQAAQALALAHRRGVIHRDI